MGGKPKGQRRYSERDWQPYEDEILKKIIDAGGNYDQVAAAVGRTKTGVILHARKIHSRMMHTTHQLTARDVQRLLGIGDAKTVALWIEKFHWLEGKRFDGPKSTHRISWPALLAMLRNRMTWMAWSPQKMADPTLREWAIKLRKGKSHWISAGDLARRFDVVIAVPQSWIERGDFIPGKTCFKYGNWWFWSRAVASYVPPGKRPRTRRGLGIHEMSRWDLFHHQHRTEWEEIGTLLEDSGKLVTFRRGRITSAVPILTRARRTTRSSPLALSDGSPERTLIHDEMVIAAGTRWLTEGSTP